MIRKLSKLINLPKKGVKFFFLYLAFSFVITFVFISAFADQKVNSTAYSNLSQINSKNNNFNIGKNRSNSSGADITWVGEDGNWSDSANWSSGYVPTGNDNVLLSSSSSIFINVDGNFTVNDLILDTGAVIELGGGSLTVNGDYIQAEGLIILDSGKFEIKGDFNFLEGDFKAEDAELSFTGDSTQIISFPFYKEDFIVSHLILKNGGAGRPKIFPGGVDVVVNNIDISAGVQFALDSNKKTEFTVNGNFHYGGIGGGTNMDSLTFFLKDTNGVISVPGSTDNNSSNSSRIEEIKNKRSKLKTIKYEFVQGKESDNVKMLLNISSDNKEVNNETYIDAYDKSNTGIKKPVVQDIYTRERLKDIIENILSVQRSDERIVIVLEDGTIIKEPQINIDNVDPHPVFDFNIEISKYSKYKVQHDFNLDTNKTLTIYGRLDMLLNRIDGAGNLAVYGDSGAYQDNGVIGTEIDVVMNFGMHGTKYYSTGGLITPVIDYNSWNFQIIADAWHPANTFIRCSSFGTKSLSGDFIINNGSDTGPARDSARNTKAAFWVKPGANFDNFGYNVIFDGGVFNPYANVIIEGNCITDHRGKISWKTTTASTLFTGNNINLNEIELNSFLNQVNYLRPIGDSAVNITARRFSFTGTSPGKWELSKVNSTNITIRDSIYINPDNPASYGGALLGNNSIPTHIILQGSIISTSNNPVQDIVNGMGNTIFEFYSPSPAITFQNAPANVTFFPNTTFSLYSSNPVLLTNNSPSSCAFTLGENGILKVTYGRFILGDADVFKYNQVDGSLILEGGTTVDSILWPVTDGPVNVTLNAAPVVVQGSRTIAGTLTMIGGMVDFGTDTLTIGTSTANTGEIIFNGGGTVRGFIKTWFAADTSSKIFPLNDYRDDIPGWPVPVKLSFTTAPTHGGTVIAKYTPAGSGTNGLPIASGPGGDIVNISPGFWTFTAGDSLTGGVYTMECTRTNISGVYNLSSLSLLKRDNSSSPWTWSPAGHLPATGTLTSPTVSFQGFTSFSDFAMGGAADNPLPVELASFTSSVSARDVTLNWSTAYENNNAGFDIERMYADNYIGGWIKIVSVTGSGTTSEAKNYSYTDKRLNTGKYKYRLKQNDYNGNFEYFELDSEIEIGVPKEFRLSQNYPNPFNPVTKIDYDLPFESKVNLKIYDMLGREVANMVSNELQTAGYYTVQLGGTNMSSGTYFFRMTAYGTNGKEFVMTKKMMLLK